MAIKNTKPKVLVAMSGGVDSSVAALLLKQQGYEVIGVFMHFWAETHPGAARHPSPEGNKCCSLASFNDARRVANKLKFPLYTVNFDRPFKKLVVDSFLAGYKAGDTPNPCVECNRHIKFELLLKKADELGADFIATGHYAKVVLRAGKYILARPKDADKDQTYFLYTLDQKKLARTLFPLADLTKPQVRAIAKKAGLAVAGKPESQEICFIPGKSHNDFLKRHLKLKPGPIKLLTPPDLPFQKGEERVSPPSLPLALRALPLGQGEKKRIQKGEERTLSLNPSLMKGKGKSELLPPLAKGRVGVGSDSRILGQHQGLPLYTIGQRKGVEIGGIGPFYVARCDYETNTLYVVPENDNKLLYKKEMTVRGADWISAIPKFPLKAKAVIRYRHLPVDCVTISNGETGLKIKFTKPQRAVTPGQSVVFYKDKEVLGGGIINR
jgi:tRNA-specific 2-thiouridylase